MSFIEVTRSDGSVFTVNTHHILTIDTVVAKTEYEGSGTRIQLGGGSLPAYSFTMVTESYDEVRRLIGLGWLRCGESFQGDICDRRLDEDGRCPVHGQVGA